MLAIREIKNSPHHSANYFLVVFTSNYQRLRLCVRDFDISKIRFFKMSFALAIDAR